MVHAEAEIVSTMAFWRSPHIATSVCGSSDHNEHYCFRYCDLLDVMTTFLFDSPSGVPCAVIAPIQVGPKNLHASSAFKLRGRGLADL